MLAFIHVAKTAGRTVETMLRRSFGPAYCHAELWRDRRPQGDALEPFTVPKYDADDFRRLKRLCPWLRCVGGHAVTLWSGIETVQPTRFFAVLRDPVVRGASHYQHHLQTAPQPLSWERWVEWTVHHDHQVKMFAGDGRIETALREIDRLGVFIGLQEEFDESLVLLQRLLAPELVLDYDRTNTARDNDVARRLLADPGTRAQLETMYAGDLELVAHVRERLLPEYRRRFGPQLSEAVAAMRAELGTRPRRTDVLAHRLVRRFWIEPWGRRVRRRSGSAST